MHKLLLYGALGIILFILDIPWLYVSGSRWSEAIQKIQGSIPRYNMTWAIPTYYALGYLVESGATFWKGFATYAVFDCTNLAIFKDYPVDLAIADSIWGGILFSLLGYVRKLIGV